MKKTLKLIIRVDSAKKSNLIEIIKKLKSLGVYNDSNNTVSYDDEDKDLEQKILTIINNELVNH